MQIKVEQQDDGMWLDEMRGESGLLAWGNTREEAIENLHFLASRLGADGLQPQTSGRDFSRDDLPNQIHMALCALVPLGVFFLALFVFKFSFPVAAALCLVSGVASMFILMPITGIIYMGLARIKYGEFPRNARVHTTDAGCASLIFVVLILILFPVFEKARETAMRRHKTNAIRQQAKPIQ